MLKLGRKPFQPDQRDLLYRNYRTKKMPVVPVLFGHWDWISDWGMLGNGSVRNCICAGADHQIMFMTAEATGKPAAFNESNAISDYSAITGYDPYHPDSDHGACVRDVLVYWRRAGMSDARGNRHKIGAFLLLDPSDLNEVLEAMYLFSSVGIGLNFPQSAMTRFRAGRPWQVVPDSPVTDGFYVPGIGYDGTYIYCVAWGQLHKMTIAFFRAYCEEAWVMLSPEMIEGRVQGPLGFDMGKLRADLSNALLPA